MTDNVKPHAEGSDDERTDGNNDTSTILTTMLMAISVRQVVVKDTCWTCLIARAIFSLPLAAPAETAVCSPKLADTKHSNMWNILHIHVHFTTRSNCFNVSFNLLRMTSAAPSRRQK
jgi:uncharacterized MnhB-related membrane protein